MRLNCLGDYKLQEKWLEDHKKADHLVYDLQNNLPIYCIYINPIWESYVQYPRKFFKAVKELQNLEDNL